MTGETQAPKARLDGCIEKGPRGGIGGVGGVNSEQARAPGAWNFSRNDAKVDDVSYDKNGGPGSLHAQPDTSSYVTSDSPKNWAVKAHDVDGEISHMGLNDALQGQSERRSPNIVLPDTSDGAYEMPNVRLFAAASTESSESQPLGEAHNKK